MQLDANGTLDGDRGFRLLKIPGPDGPAGVVALHEVVQLIRHPAVLRRSPEQAGILVHVRESRYGPCSPSPRGFDASGPGTAFTGRR